MPETAASTADGTTHAGGASASAPREIAEIFLIGSDTLEPVEDATLEDVPRLIRRAQRAPRFVWVNLVEPEKDAVQRARATLGIHPTVAVDVVSHRQQPKVQTLNDHLFVLLWSVLRKSDDSLVLGDTYLCIGDAWLLTVQRGNGGELPDLPGLLGHAQPDSRSASMPAAHVIMAHVVDGYANAAAEVETALEELEAQVFSEDAREDHRRIYRVRKDIGRIDRAVSSIAAALNESTSHLATPKVDREMVLAYLHDLMDDAAGTAALISNQSNGLDAILSSYEHTVATRQNQDMRTISAFAALLAVPTLIAGLYGMNFDHIPLAQWEFGWTAVGAAVAAIDTVLYGLFKRRRWL